MSGIAAILPETGRWHGEAVTEGQPHALVLLVCPSTTSLRLAVPLPVPGRN